MKITPTSIERLALGENALWDADGQLLYVIDVLGQKVIQHDPATDATKVWPTPAQVGVLALRESGGAIIGMEDSLFSVDFVTGEIGRFAGPAFSGLQARVNDGAADKRGRFVFGGCCIVPGQPQPVGGLYAVGGDRRTVKLDGGIYQSNCHCFSPDGRTLYAGDSHVKHVYAYDYDLDTGQVANKRLFADTAELGIPDGSTVDADGLVWVSLFQGGKVAVYRPDGKLERTFEMPVQLITSVAWGGPGLDRLYVTTIEPTQLGFPAEEKGGFVFVVDDLGTRGLPESRFAG